MDLSELIIMDLSELIIICKSFKGAPLSKYRKEIIEFTPFLSDDAAFAQRIWHIRNELFESKRCLVPGCNNLAKFMINHCKYICCSDSCRIKLITIRSNEISKTEEYRQSVKDSVNSFFSKCDKTAYLDKRKQTNLKKYGTESSSANLEVKNKIFSTNLERYGTKIPSMTTDVKQKISKTMLDLDGSWIEKMENTNLERYGAKNVSKNQNVIKKIRTSFENNVDKEKWIGKIKESQKKVDIVARKEKSIKTSLEKYGHEHFVQSEEYKSKKLEDNINKFMNKIGENYNLIKYGSYQIKKLDKIHEIHHHICDKTFKIAVSTCSERINNKQEICLHCNPFLLNCSKGEKEVVDFIRSIYDQEIVENTRSIISPYELDIYLPDLNLAIEFNGVYWHSTDKKAKLYHQKKYLKCKEKGIRLIQINDFDWKHHQDTVKSILQTSICPTLNNDLDIKNLQIREADKIDAKFFMKENNIEDFIKFSFAYAIYDKEEMIQYISFKNINSKIYELCQFSTKNFTNINDGLRILFDASKEKLIKLGCNKLILTINPEYQDSKQFEEIGFVYNKITAPSYKYFDSNISLKLNEKEFTKIATEEIFLETLNSGELKYEMVF